MAKEENNLIFKRKIGIIRFSIKASKPKDQDLKSTFDEVIYHEI
jgi:hypothetical protein